MFLSSMSIIRRNPYLKVGKVACRWILCACLSYSDKLKSRWNVNLNDIIAVYVCSE